MCSEQALRAQKAWWLWLRQLLLRRPETPAERAHAMFTLLGLRHMCVVDENSRVRGIITRRDLDYAAGHGAWRRNKMAPPPPPVSPSGKIHAPVRTMREFCISCKHFNMSQHFRFHPFQAHACWRIGNGRGCVLLSPGLRLPSRRRRSTREVLLAALYTVGLRSSPHSEEQLPLLTDNGAQHHWDNALDKGVKKVYACHLFCVLTMRLCVDMQLWKM